VKTFQQVLEEVGYAPQPHIMGGEECMSILIRRPGGIGRMFSEVLDYVAKYLRDGGQLAHAEEPVGEAEVVYFPGIYYVFRKE
jgi:hypothetical protein